MRIKVYVEGGGEKKLLRSKCRQGFSNFFQKAGMEGRMPSVVASGSRRDAFDDFCAALRSPGKYDFIVLLVDSEDPIAAGSSPWQHLKARDSWNQPLDATDDQVHLMVQCMEAWFLADKDCLIAYYGNGFNQNALPASQDIENIAKNDVLNGLKNATRSGVSKDEYGKGQHSFDILAQIDPDKVVAASPHAKRLVDTLEGKSRITGLINACFAPTEHLFTKDPPCNHPSPLKCHMKNQTTANSAPQWNVCTIYGTLMKTAAMNSSATSNTHPSKDSRENPTSLAATHPKYSASTAPITSGTHADAQKARPSDTKTPPTTSPLSIGTSGTSGMPPAKTAFTGKNRDQPSRAHQKANLAGAQTAPPTSSSGKTNTTSTTRHTAKSFRAVTRVPSPSPPPTLPMDPGRDWVGPLLNPADPTTGIATAYTIPFPSSTKAKSTCITKARPVKNAAAQTSSALKALPLPTIQRDLIKNHR